MTQPHPHWREMLEYAEDMAKDAGIVWQVHGAQTDWADMVGHTPRWHPDCSYRRKPVTQPTISIEFPIRIGLIDFVLRVVVDPDDDYAVISAEFVK